MKITLKRTNGKYLVTVDGKRFPFNKHYKAWDFAFNVRDYGVKYTCEVYDKIRCMRELGILHKGDERKIPTRQMLLEMRSGILMDNAIRGVIMGDYTLDELLIRKGVLQ